MIPPNTEMQFICRNGMDRKRAGTIMAREFAYYE